MGWTPPSKATVILSFLLWLAGIVIFILVYLGYISFPYDNIVAFALVGVAWLLMLLGVRLKGM
ncbi:MAG: hypothetical protein ACFE8M_02205 [Candidatus Hermodarchaeota archaeon]